MRKPILLLIALIFLLLLSQCKSNEVEKLEQQVLALHDTVMVEMKDLQSVQRRLDAALLEMDSLSADSIDLNLYAEIQNAKTLISSSYKEMMDWMRDYNKPGSDRPQEEITAYLEAQYENMKAIRQKMKDGINKANALLPKE